MEEFHLVTQIVMSFVVKGQRFVISCNNNFTIEIKELEESIVSRSELFLE
jgi:hypothetical protein